jgi:glycosyltransferase involved in cell wall biosynthesis
VPLRLALVHSFYSSRQPSGENTQVQAEEDALRQAGVDVALIAARSDELEGEPLYRVRSAGRVATGWGASPLAAIEAFDPDVVHVHNLFPNLGRRWVRRIEVPLVVTLHNYRFACVSGSLFRAGRLCTDCPDGTGWAALRHRCYRGSLAATLPVALGQRGGPSADPVLARAARILCLSTRQRRMLEAAGLASQRLVDWASFLPEGLDPGIAPARRSGCLFVGRLSAEKGVLELVRSWTGHTPLVVAGGGPLVDDVRRAASGRSVTVLGPLDRPAVLAHMARSAVLVIPGMTPEVAAPLCYIEALASGLPVIARRASDLGSTVSTDGVGAVVDDVGQVPDTAARLARDATLSARCRAVYEARYTEQAWRRRALDLYTDLVGAR